MALPKAGQKLRCSQCGTEAVVVRAPGAEVTCCGRPLGEPETSEATRA